MYGENIDSRKNVRPDVVVFDEDLFSTDMDCTPSQSWQTLDVHQKQLCRDKISLNHRRKVFKKQSILIQSRRGWGDGRGAVVEMCRWKAALKLVAGFQRREKNHVLGWPRIDFTRDLSGERKKFLCFLSKSGKKDLDFYRSRQFSCKFDTTRL